MQSRKRKGNKHSDSGPVEELSAKKSKVVNNGKKTFLYLSSSEINFTQAFPMAISRCISDFVDIVENIKAFGQKLKISCSESQAKILKHDPENF